MAKFIEEHEELTLISPATPTFRGKSVLDFYLVTSNTAERGVTVKVGPDLPDHNYLSHRERRRRSTFTRTLTGRDSVRWRPMN